MTVSSLGKESAVNSRLFDPATSTSEQSITRALHAGEDEAESSEMLHMSRVGSKLQKSVMSDRVRVQVEDVTNVTPFSGIRPITDVHTN